MKFHVINLGCKVNRVESDGITAALLACEGESAATAEADIIVINTCAVTGEAEKKTRKAIRRALRENAHAHVVITGCAASLNPEKYRLLNERVVVEIDKLQVVAKVCELIDLQEENKSLVHANMDTFGAEKHPPQNDSRLTELSPLRTGEGFVTRVGIKVQDGCDNACTYCIVHTARGKAWSRSATDILNEVMAYEKAGIKEIILTGINVGSYQDFDTDFSDLLALILTATTQLRIRISSIEPHSLSQKLVDLIAVSEGRICRHLHLPLQSGSTRILDEMARPYSAEQFLDLVASLYHKIPRLSLSTDIIVGFPSETTDDFAQTLQVARECRFSKVHIFPYSKREGTPAAQRIDQVPAEVVRRRVDELTDCAAELRAQDRKRRVGTSEYVLVESGGVGMSESYHRVSVDDKLPVGETLQMIL